MASIPILETNLFILSLDSADDKSCSAQAALKGVGLKIAGMKAASPTNRGHGLRKPLHRPPQIHCTLSSNITEIPANAANSVTQSME
ncbi:unnamed protein product [Colias eurytheme]|nr:unnamed protein product [Colias eurytheme]